MRFRNLSPGAQWATLVLPGALFFATTLRGPLAERTWVSAPALFWLVLVITTLCGIGAIGVVVIGWRRRLAEVVAMGTFLTITSILPFVHGLTTPGVLYGDNTATAVSVFIAVPLAVVAALPLITPGLTVSRAVARSWKLWSVGSISVALVVAAALLVWPDAVPAPAPGRPLALLFLAISLAGTGILSLRQLRLYAIGRRPASLIASAGFMTVGLSSLVWLAERPFSTAWWGAHLIDALGAFAAIFGLALAHFRDRSLVHTLLPVVNRDPLVALELGLTPVVHRYVASLERKDEVTRDHVVRVGELAMRLGVRLGLSPKSLRTLGLAALLHDVGKLDTPDAILRKPGELTEEEYELIKEHTLRGAELMASAPVLAPAANLVRWHHERADGNGYPDGLAEDQIPVEAAIISVCDAWDAMTFARRYRLALSPARAREVMLEGAGSQWPTEAVTLLLEEIDESGPVEQSIFAAVGREGPVTREHLEDVCLEALPETIRTPVAR